MAFVRSAEFRQGLGVITTARGKPWGVLDFIAEAVWEAILEVAWRGIKGAVGTLRPGSRDDGAG